MSDKFLEQKRHTVDALAGSRLAERLGQSMLDNQEVEVQDQGETIRGRVMSSEVIVRFTIEAERREVTG